ncbi:MULTISPECIES: hypothetical protein [unclassified Lysobacter]
MTTTERTAPTANPTPAETARVVPFTLSNPRERDFGVGYGKSSGYATTRRYTTEWAGPRFRVA